MPLPSRDIQTMMKAAAWHAEITGDEAGMRDYLEEHYGQTSSPYQRRRALELATQAIGVGLRLREADLPDELRIGLANARAPAQTVGVRVRLNFQDIGTRPGFSSPAPQFTDRYIPMRWDQTVRDVGAAIRDMLSVLGYTAAEIAAIEWAGARAGGAGDPERQDSYTGAWWEFVGPTLFPIS